MRIKNLPKSKNVITDQSVNRSSKGNRVGRSTQNKSSTPSKPVHTVLFKRGEGYKADKGGDARLDWGVGNRRMSNPDKADRERTAPGKKDRDTLREFSRSISKDFRKKINVTVKKKSK